MTTTTAPAPRCDQELLEAFIGRVVGDSAPRSAPGWSSSATGSGSTGRWPTASRSPPTSSPTAPAPPRAYVRAVAGQPGGRRVRRVRPGHRHATRMTPEQAFALGRRRTSPAFFAGSMQLALGTLRDVRRSRSGSAPGSGFGWHEHDPDLFDGTERFFRPGYVANLVSLLAARARRRRRQARAGRRDGRRRRLRPRRVHDPDGPGVPGLHVPRARLPRGFGHRRPAAGRRGRRGRPGPLRGRRRHRAPGRPVPTWSTMFDCLHDMGDPVAAARAALAAAARTAP